MPYMVFSTPFTRPANSTDYAAGDLIANSETAGSVVVPGLTLPKTASAIKITGGILRKSGAGVTNADFAAHLFSGSTVPVPTVGDNGALNASQVMASTGGGDVVGVLTGAKANIRAWTGGAYCPLTVSILPYILIGTTNRERTILFLLEALAAYDPGSAETFSLGLLWEPIVDDPSVT